MVGIIINYPIGSSIESRIKLLNQVVNMILDYEGVLYSDHSLLASFKNYERAEIFKMTVEVEEWEGD